MGAFATGLRFAYSLVMKMSPSDCWLVWEMRRLHHFGIRWVTFTPFGFLFYCLSSHQWRPSYMVFSRKMVHILPGYPKQSPEDPEVTMVAFYLSLPPEVSQGTVVPKDSLTIIVESNIASIGRSMDSFIVSVKPLSLPAKEFQTNNYKSNKLGANHTAAIVGGAVGGCFFLVVIVVLLRAYGRRKRYVHYAKEGCFNQPVGDETAIKSSRLQKDRDIRIFALLVDIIHMLPLQIWGCCLCS